MIEVPRGTFHQWGIKLADKCPILSFRWTVPRGNLYVSLRFLRICACLSFSGLSWYWLLLFPVLILYAPSLKLPGILSQSKYLLPTSNLRLCFRRTQTKMSNILNLVKSRQWNFAYWDKISESNMGKYYLIIEQVSIKYLLVPSTVPCTGNAASGTGY